jgi:CheY-like chemotaxis protein
MEKIKNILLVDDDEITNYINSDLIKSMNISELVTVAPSGKEAIEYLQKALEPGHETDSGEEIVFPDFIFLDVNMPEMDGFGFLENYVKLFRDSGKSSVIIMLTTSFIKEEVAKALNMNNVVKGYVEKPLTAEIVTEITKKHIAVSSEQ